MRVLVIGGGAREHALAWKISESPLLTNLFVAPGNPGTAKFAENVPIAADGVSELATWALENKIDLTVVGPEAPLALGLVDEFSKLGLKVFGPTKAASKLEASKSYAKQVMLAEGVKTAKAEIFSDYERALCYLREHGAPVVIKADGLAAGKGVTVAMELPEAEAALRECLLESRFGDSGASVVIEDYISGREASVMGIVSGQEVLPFVVSQDYKRLLDDDQGPNTGGMGAITPTAVLKDSMVDDIVENVFKPVLRGLKKQGIDYLGFLYAGIIVDSAGEASVLEFNCRMGDPETQALMLRLDSDLLSVLKAAVNGEMSPASLNWSSDSVACVVASSKGYPLKVEDGKEISGLDQELSDVKVFQAGTEVKEGKLLTKGGRVLSVVGRGQSLDEALKKSYALMETIDFEGKHYRSDIGK